MIHAYQLFDKNIVLDIESGCVHVVDDTAFKVLTVVAPVIEANDDLPSIRSTGLIGQDEGEINTAKEALDELMALKESGQLFSLPIEIDIKPDDAAYTVKALCLNIAHDCNLDCVYCFAGKGNYQKQTALMNLDTAKAAIDFLLIHSGTRHNVEVDFFGGEPLLNVEVVKATVVYARSLEKKHNKKFRFTLTTNGLLLDDSFVAFANAELDNVVLSLDGRKDIHDAVRKTKNGGATFDLVVPKIQRFSRRRAEKDHYIRGTFTRYNLDFCADVKAMVELGFNHISLEPVTSHENAKYAITQKDLPAVLNEYEKLAAYLLDLEEKGKKVNFFHFNIDLDGGPCLKKLISGCGAGGDYLAVSPDGRIYPCHQFVGIDEFELGNLKEGIKKTDVIKNFSSVNLTKKPECQKCFAKYYCGGGCMANGYKYANGIDGVYSIGCEMQKKRVECAIALNAIRATRRIL